MKVSELIAKLEETLRTEGDIDVICWPNDGQGSFYDLGQIVVFDTTGDPAGRVVELNAGRPRAIPGWPVEEGGGV